MKNKAMKKNIALVCGGYTGEYEISIASAEQIYKNLKDDYNVYKIIINKQEWFFESSNKKIYIDKNDFSLTLDGNKICFDFAFIIVHGTPGENGLLQSYFDMLSIPYNTCSALVSAVTFDKQICNAVVKQMNIVNVANNTFVHKDDKEISLDEIISKVKLPVFVKPSQGGSSLATFKVTKREELLPCIEKAFEIDDKVLIEEYIKGREFSCGVMIVDNKVMALPVAEICPKTDFFDWQAKYQGLSEEKVPAPIDETMTTYIQRLTERIYKNLNCRGVCRIDYIWDTDKNELYFLEINTTPGQSEESIVPKQVRCMNKDVKWLYKMQITNVLK